MHELSIALNIAEIIDEEMSKNKHLMLLEVEIEVGKLSGVVPELLLFALKEGIPEHPLHHAEIKITEPEGKGKCLHCQKISSIENYFDQCQHCHQFGFEIIAGKELKVKSLLFS
ncbi:MAG TPA: hydrogenase maturation nickel metallochaperone HypA [Bacteroidia bacterium]|nr:hydrogenase maturation nickel metallochaperone HypA [Sphingobacteriales bacterium]HPD65814.1 hydrogenase maturation nickel metallochaperone HypA [Bacteroidia bacterium]HRS59751.1 hydrogenase maturation nickel metallochaperone HypA [Bacteroidia bacterium]HRU69217.1 hydrogenase maturation nickel metallochaperone HypA [Bacteroidia bacterium]